MDEDDDQDDGDDIVDCNLEDYNYIHSKSQQSYMYTRLAVYCSAVPVY